MTVTRGFSLRVETKSTQGAPFPPESRHARELTNGGRAPPRAAAHQSTRGTLPPTHSRHHDDGRHTRTPPMLVGDPVPTERPAAQSCKATGTTDPPIPSTGPARRRTPVSDLFHEPEAHPKTAAAGAPPEVTVRDHHPSPGGHKVIQPLWEAPSGWKIARWVDLGARLGSRGWTRDEAYSCATRLAASAGPEQERESRIQRGTGERERRWLVDG